MEHTLAQSIGPSALRLPRRVPWHDRCWLSRRWIERFLRQHVASMTGRGLDYGCGEMPYAGLIRQHCQELVGVDVESRGPACDLVVPRGAPLPFADRSFQFVLCTQVLEHTPDPEATLRELARVLQRGGRLFLTIPFVYEQHEMPRDYWRFTEPGLCELARRVGLSVDSIEPGGGLIEVIGQLLMVKAPALGPLHRLTFPCLNLLWAGLDRVLRLPGLTCNWHAVLRAEAATA